jgi:hypothetical protein
MIVLIVTVLFNFSTFSAFVKNDAEQTETGIEEILPEGLKLYFSKKADLNSDGIDDFIAVCTISDSISNKPVLVYFGQNDGTYKFKGRNDRIAFEDFNNIAVTRNYFTVENRYGTNVTYSTLNYTFKIVDNEILFHRFDDATYEILDFDKGPELNHIITKRAKELNYPTFENYKN